MAEILHLSKRLVRRPEVISPLGIELRFFQGESDIPVWLDLRHRAFSRAQPGILSWSPAEFAAEFQAKPWWSPDRIWFAVARDAGGHEETAVGTVALADRPVTGSILPAVHWLAVLPAWRRLGIGRLLMAALERRCWDAGQREVFLETHAGWTAAGRLYSSLGYEPVSEDEPMK